MLRRLTMGLIEGLVIGLALGFAATRGLGLNAAAGVTASLLGAATGFAVGLVAGRPIWARDGKTEALLKAGAGALVGSALAFAAARWLKVAVDLSAFQLGAGPVGKLPAALLPLLAITLALFFELDDGTSPPPPRIASAPPKPRSAPPRLRTPELAELERDEPANTEQRRGKR